jgi:hypothetical protein
MNLVLTVIVDRATAARVEDEGFKLQQKKEEWKKSTEKLYRWCAEMDTDKSGTVSLEELASCYASNSDFKATLATMDVGTDDVRTVFDILDEDNSGAVIYEQFVSQLYKFKTQEPHTLLAFIQHYVQDVRRKLQQRLDVLNTELFLKKIVEDQTVFANQCVQLSALAKEVGIRSSLQNSAVSRLSEPSSCVESPCVVGPECLQVASSAARAEDNMSLPQDRTENNPSGAFMGASCDDPSVQASRRSRSAEGSALEALREVIELS